MKIKVQTTLKAPLSDIWQKFTNPEDVKNWNFASDDWTCPSAKNNLKIGERFSYRMESKDCSMGFDFEGTYLEIVEFKFIKFSLDDGRSVEIRFDDTAEGVVISETFTAEDQNSAEQQKQGWQSILDNFKKYVEKI